MTRFVLASTNLYIKVFMALAASASLLAPGASSAQAVTLNSIDTGWYDSTGNHTPFNTNYISGNIDPTSFRSFFVFDLSSVVVPVGEAIVSATLTANAYTVTNDGQTLNLFDYTGAISNLLDGSGGLPAFDDLGNGVNFGNRVFNASDSNQLISYNLNQNFVDTVNSSLSGLFAIGARNSNELNLFNYVYGFSGGTPATLDLQLGPVPTPGPLPLAGLAAALGYSRQLRRRIKSSCLAGASKIS